LGSLARGIAAAALGECEPERVLANA